VSKSKEKQTAGNGGNGERKSQRKCTQEWRGGSGEKMSEGEEKDSDEQVFNVPKSK